MTARAWLAWLAWLVVLAAACGRHANRMPPLSNRGGAEVAPRPAMPCLGGRLRCSWMTCWCVRNG